MKGRVQNGFAAIVISLLAGLVLGKGGLSAELDPKGEIHIPIGIPNTVDALKTFVEAEGGFSPGFGTYGIYVWVYDRQSKRLVASTMDGVPSSHGLTAEGYLIPWADWRAGELGVAVSFAASRSAVAGLADCVESGKSVCVPKYTATRGHSRGSETPSGNAVKHFGAATCGFWVRLGWTYEGDLKKSQTPFLTTWQYKSERSLAQWLSKEALGRKFEIPFTSISCERRWSG